MFDIGFWEMLVIGVMALVVLGPERLPGAIRQTISTIRSVKDMANGFKQEVASQLDTHELHANLKKAEALGMENLGQDLKNSVEELKAAAASVQTPYKKNKAVANEPQIAEKSTIKADAVSNQATNPPKSSSTNND
jgi:sec-independent protein translocase protein TatB